MIRSGFLRQLDAEKKKQGKKADPEQGHHPGTESKGDGGQDKLGYKKGPYPDKDNPIQGRFRKIFQQTGYIMSQIVILMVQEYQKRRRYRKEDLHRRPTSRYREGEPRLRRRGQWQPPFLS